MQENQHSKVLTLINMAVEHQKKRYKSSLIYNANLTPALVARHCQLSPVAANLLHTESQRQALTSRGSFKVIKVARTIADLAGSEHIQPEHLAEALAFRDPFQP
jgi:magnesium chelatase family protein